MGVLKLFNVVAAQKLVPNNSLRRTTFALPAFTSGDKWTIEYQALSGLGAPYEVIDVATYTLEIGIYASNGTTQLAYQNTFTAVGSTNIYTGQLNCSDAAFITAVAALTPESEPVSAYLDIKFIDSSGRKHSGLPANREVQLFKTLIPIVGGTTTPPSETPTSEERVRLMAVMRDDDSTPLIKKSLDGSKTFRLWLNNDGDWEKQDIT